MSFNYPDRAKQLVDFAGLKYGTLKPTDIDGLIEYKNRGYVILELKYKNTEVGKGQRRALARMNDDFETAQKRSLCIIASHDVADCKVPIIAAEGMVREYRFKGEWKQLSNWTVKDLINRFLESEEFK